MPHLSEQERRAVTFSIEEYDKYRDQNNSLSGRRISSSHGWNDILQQLNIPKSQKGKESYSSDEISKLVLDFAREFKTQNGRDPIPGDYVNARKEKGLPTEKYIKKMTGLTLSKYFLSLGLTLPRSGLLANLPYRDKDGVKD